MTDHPDPETNPLRDRLTDTLRDHISKHAEHQALAVIEALALDFDYKIVRNPDGKHLETIYRVAGGWTEAGGDW